MELGIVFVKHSAPNHMLAPILHIQPQSLYMGRFEPTIEDIVQLKKWGGGGGGGGGEGRVGDGEI